MSHQKSKIDPQRLMQVVASQPGAQFTPAGVLRLPLDGADAPAQVLARLKEHLSRLG